MIIKSLELDNIRNYKYLDIQFDPGVNILYGDNAQGKTNILEAIYVSATTKSHRGNKDSEIINFNTEEAHIKTYLDKEGLERRVDMHLRKSKSKGIAVDLVKLKKNSEILGLLNVIFFSPEDLSIIKDSPSKRRRFVDMELCQLDSIYLYDLNNYNKVVNQRNKLLKDINFNRDYKDMLNIWDTQIISYGKKIIERRKIFIDQLNEIIYRIHKNLSSQNEELIIKYVPYVEVEEFEEVMKKNMEKDVRTKMTNAGPHRDDFIFCSNGMDLRTYGSQGQQRTAALSLKLSEIELVKKVIKDKPVLLLDDVLSELDGNRQKNLLDNIGDIQTIITCTGLDEFVNDRFELNKVYKVTNGEVTQMS